VIVYNGSGLMGREVDTIRSSDIVIIAGGRSGTLGEFSIAYDEGHLIGVLTGTGGIADHVEKILEVISVKDTGARVLSDDDPVALVDRLIAEQHRRLQERRPQRQPMRSEPAPG
jgi:predicted Rossmann-fold nucleotide-binding protein